MTRNGTRPVELVLAAYLLLTAAMIVPFHARLAAWPAYLAIHVLGAAGLWALGHSARSMPAAVEVGRRLLPLLVGPLLYAEVAALNDLVFGTRYFDAPIMRLEVAMFGAQMASHLRELLPSRPLSEFLHFAYFSYYGIPLLLWGALAARRRFDALDEYLTVLGFTFVACMAWFVLFPVAGPFYTLVPPDPQAMGSVFPPLVHRVLHANASQGAAFPSSHVAVSGAVLVMAARHDRFSFALLAVLVPALAVGAVYGGFHYAIDAVAGAVWCALCAVVALRLHRRLSITRDGAAGRAATDRSARASSPPPSEGAAGGR